jgi:hypothetical protein
VLECDAAFARRWKRGAVPGWLPRGALPVAWAVAFGVGVVPAHGPCPVADPSICAPGNGWAVAVALIVATPVLLVALPAFGCLTGVVLGLVELSDSAVPAARFGFGLLGLACGVVLLAMLASRHRQAALVRGPGISFPLPVAPVRAMGGGYVVAVPLAVGAIALLLSWRAAQAQDARHLAAAARLDATVIAEVDDGASVLLRLPDGDHATVEVHDRYPVGAVVPVLADRDLTFWVSLVAEPPDHTARLGTGLAAALVAAGAVGWERGRRRLAARIDEGAPAVTVLGVRTAVGRVDLWDTEGTAAFARVAVGPDRIWERRPERWWEPGNDVWTVAQLRREAAVTFARQQVPVRMTAVGDLRCGGWVALVDGASVYWPARPVRLHRGGTLSVPGGSL